MMSQLTFALALLAAGSVAHAETLHCVADGYTQNIRSVTATTQQDGTLKVETAINNNAMPTVTVNGTLDQFEVLVPGSDRMSIGLGTNHFVLKKISTNRYALYTETHCEPAYQEETCQDKSEIIHTSIDTQVWCNLN